MTEQSRIPPHRSGSAPLGATPFADTDAVHELSVGDVTISEGARKAIDQAFDEVASRLGLTREELAAGRTSRLFWLEPSESLVVVLPLSDHLPHVPEEGEDAGEGQEGASLFVQVPEGQWSIRERSGKTH